MASFFLMVHAKTYRSFTSFFLQRMIMKGLSQAAALVLQHATQAGLFVYSVYVVLVNDWCTTHAAFVILQACAHFMKMHSYITVNRYLWGNAGISSRTTKRQRKREDRRGRITQTTSPSKILYSICSRRGWCTRSIREGALLTGGTHAKKCACRWVCYLWYT